MSADMLAQAFASTAGVLAGVEEQQLGGATPCASWKVRELVNHIVGGTTYFAVTAEIGQAPEGGDAPDFCDGDFVSEFNRGAARAVKAFEADGAMDKTMKLPFCGSSRRCVHQHRGHRHLHPRMGPRHGDRSADRSRPRAGRTALGDRPRVPARQPARSRGHGAVRPESGAARRGVRGRQAGRLSGSPPLDPSARLHPIPTRLGIPATSAVYTGWVSALGPSIHRPRAI